MSNLEHKIEANDRSIQQVLDKQKYTVDYFQREYSWGKKHIEQLVSDLTSAFLSDYDPSHQRKDGIGYNSYYLGPFVLSKKDSVRSIIDGQQRLTSLTLFLIFLHNHQSTLEIPEEERESITDMIFSASRGEKSFNITVEERVPCLRSLFEHGHYESKEDDDESTRNMAERYQDIANVFPDEIDARAFPFFIDWLKENVVLVEIVAYSDDNAYTIFETMNDRGLSLTSTEMLKGYLLSRFEEPRERKKADQIWKKLMLQLHGMSKDADQHFFQAWLRAHFADTIRQSKAGSANEDFENIGTRFHTWFRDRLSLMGLSPNNTQGFRSFVTEKLPEMVKTYLTIWEAEHELNPKLPHVYYASRWGIADSLADPLMLAPLTSEDTEETKLQKIDLVAQYIEAFCVRRAVNYRKFSASSIRYTMCTLTKEIRGKSLDDLREIFSQRLESMDETWDGVLDFRMHQMNKKFIKFLLSRISGFIDQQSGLPSDFKTYYNGSGKPFEIEHIWADKFARHQDEFDQLHEFSAYRNRLGGLVLLQRGTNQSFSDLPYDEKQPHYAKENLLAKSLCTIAYENNPNFTKAAQSLGLPFQAHDEFKKANLDDRQALYKMICELIWHIPRSSQDVSNSHLS